ncbi:MAG: hypothetical protein AB1750_06530 [Chloroflexota bacterium]
MTLNPLPRRVNESDARAPLRYWSRVAAWSLGILLAFELVIRFFVMRLPPHVYEAEWGFVPVPNSSSVQGREGFGALHYLADGEIRTPFEGGRVAVVMGDSTVQAAQVNDDVNFISLAETELRARGLDVDLRNLGRAERTVADHVFVAPAVNAKYAPEVVIIQVSPASFSLAWDPAKENHFADLGNGEIELVHEDRSAQAANDNLVFASGLLSFFNFRWQVTSQGLAARYAEWIPGAVAAQEPPAGEGVSFESQVAPQVQALKDAYPHSQIVFLVVPYTPSIEYDGSQKLSWVSGEDQALANLLAKEPGVRVIYVRDEFRKYYERNHALPRGSFNSAFNFGHLNRDGHIVVAQALVEALEEILR